MSSVQQYDTDALQPHVDSTPVLLRRLEQWSRAVNSVVSYSQGQYHLYSGISHDLEKLNKSLNAETPEFPDIAAQGAAPNPADVSLGNVFSSLRTTISTQFSKATSTAQGIKASVIPQLESLQSDVEKHFKTLRTQGGRGIKEIEKSRETTQRLVEQLGRVTSSFGSRGIEHKDDPYVIKRRVLAAVYDQVGQENTQAEAALSVQRTFATLEVHIMDVMRSTLETMEQLITAYAETTTQLGNEVTTKFNTVDLSSEWNNFLKTNAEQLVPEENYQRNPSHVHFHNENHVSTTPIIEGMLQRKGTTLKQYHSGFYVVTPAGYLHQFKTASPTEDTTPELSLYLPDCQLSGNSMDFTFRVVGKGANKVISTRHKYSFKTTSQAELESWYRAIARVTGQPVEESTSPTSAPGSPAPEDRTPSPAPAATHFVASPTQVPATAAAVTPAATAAPTSTAVPSSSFSVAASNEAAAHVPAPTASSAQPLSSQVHESATHAAPPTSELDNAHLSQNQAQGPNDPFQSF